MNAPQNHQLDRLAHVLGLLDAGCPVGRHELTDREWHALGLLRAQRDQYVAERAAQNRR